MSSVNVEDSEIQDFQKALLQSNINVIHDNSLLDGTVNIHALQPQPPSFGNRTVSFPMEVSCSLSGGTPFSLLPATAAAISLQQQLKERWKELSAQGIPSEEEYKASVEECLTDMSRGTTSHFISEQGIYKPEPSATNSANVEVVRQLLGKYIRVKNLEQYGYDPSAYPSQEGCLHPTEDEMKSAAAVLDDHIKTCCVGIMSVETVRRLQLPEEIARPLSLGEQVSGVVGSGAAAAGRVLVRALNFTEDAVDRWTRGPQ